jgi:hypothetical protein
MIERKEVELHMNRRLTLFILVCILLLPFAMGCNSKPLESPKFNEEPALREKFMELQAMIKTQDAVKLWAMLDTKSQADAAREAKNVQALYAQATAEEKRKQEESLGLTGSDMTQPIGLWVLKTKQFHQKYGELAESKIEKMAVEGNSGTLHYSEADGDQEKLIFLREDGQWKVWLSMPKLVPSQSK